jgi:hypothetical protein
MSVQDHKISDGICIWCHEIFPCTTVKIRWETTRLVMGGAVAAVQPKTPEPVCCDEHAAVWQALQDAADELDLWAAEEADRIKIGTE